MTKYNQQPGTEEVSFALPHLTLAGWTNGHVGKPVLLALHGWLDNASSFEPLLPWLDDYQVFSIDLPGHGLSAHRSCDANYHFVEWIYDIAELIRVAKWDNVTLVGHSMGGMISSVVASVLPQKIKRVVLIDSVGLITTPQQSACEQLRLAIESRQLMIEKVKNVYPTIEAALMARVKAGDLSEKEVRFLLKRGIKAVDGGVIWRSDPRLRTHSAMRFSQEQAKSFISQIQCPVLLIEGENGFKQRSENRELYTSFYPNLECQEIPGGHHCHMEYPALTGQAIQRTENRR